MSTTTFEVIRPEPPRDRWGRPLITPPDGSKAVAYTRCTTYVDCLDDKTMLQKWMQRMVAVGIGTRSDLHLSAASLAADPDGNKKALDELCDSARDAAKASAKATIGTALHAWVEQINLGFEPVNVPDEYRTHLDNYRAATTALHPIHVERFTVADDLQIGGTPDLIATVDGLDGAIVCDLKTGPATLKYGQLKVAMQMAVYAHSKLYDPATGERTPLDVRTDVGLVIALDSETGKCELHWIDLKAGWEAVQVATQVRQWRSRKGLTSPYTAPEPALVAVPRPSDDDVHLEQAILRAIDESPTREALLDLWGKASDHWTDALTEAAKNRLQAIANPAA